MQITLLGNWRQIVSPGPHSPCFQTYEIWANYGVNLLIPESRMVPSRCSCWNQQRAPTSITQQVGPDTCRWCQPQNELWWAVAQRQQWYFIEFTFFDPVWWCVVSISCECLPTMSTSLSDFLSSATSVGLWSVFLEKVLSAGPANCPVQCSPSLMFLLAV